MNYTYYIGNENFYGYSSFMLHESAAYYGKEYLLEIDKNHNIILPQYGNTVITMNPMPKSLYILFLNHPEGILLKNISNYRAELERIYRKVSGRNNPTMIKRVMEEVTIPLNNTIYKNISIIRASFLNKIGADAEHFIPMRRTYGNNTLTLDCKLVIKEDNSH